jgi:hypothetical protein
MSEFMVWHAKNKSNDGLVRHALDSKVWAHINASWPDFASEPHNVILGLATDGVNPYGEKKNNWSTWPILLLNYNSTLACDQEILYDVRLLILSKEFIKMHNLMCIWHP